MDDQVGSKPEPSNPYLVGALLLVMWALGAYLVADLVMRFQGLSMLMSPIAF